MRTPERSPDTGSPTSVRGDLGEDVERYYAAAATSYDRARFGGSYGRHVDRQERAVLREWLPRSGRILDLGCGTGRLLGLATHGLDRSAEMLAVARAKCPGRRVVRALSWRAPFPEGAFDAVFSMHVFMHLPTADVAATLAECERLVRPGGMLVFDVPSTPRRKLTRFRPASWHCATEFTPEELRSLCARWRFLELRGVLALPIHRMPEWSRPMALPLDDLICRSPLRRWCSYYVVRLERPCR